jgi:Ca2+-binding RTX toxin-like protein
MREPSPIGLSLPSAGSGDGLPGGLGSSGTLDLIEGDDGDDSLQGTGGDDEIRGFGGHDTLFGGDGNDLIAGGAGNDSLDGGAGFDFVDFSDAGGGVLVNFGGFDGIGTALWSAGEDTVTGFEGIIGSAFGDSMIGSSADNVFIGGAGDDTIHGELGNDRVEYGAATAAVFVSLAAGSAFGGAGSDVLFGIENAYGSELHGDELRGSDVANELRGLGGNDSLIGRGGNDTLIGGEGDDSVFGEGGEDLLQGGLGNDSYRVDYAVTEHDTIADEGGASDTLSVDTIGFATPSLYRATGDLVLEFFDNLDGQGLTRILEVVDHEGSGRIEGIAFVTGSESPALLYSMAAGASGTTGNDVVAGTADADSLTGLNGNDRLWAHLGDDSVDAGGGGDIVYGAAGNDTLVGGIGADYLYGEAGSDLYGVDDAGDVVSELASNGAGGVIDAGGTDTVQVTLSTSGSVYVLGQYLENLELLGTAAIRGTGNSGANTITGNTAANVLDGAGGSDTLIGGQGSDTYVVDSALDVVIESGSASTDIDTVQSTIAYALGATIERLILSGTSAINGTGNTLDNRLTGNTAANVLNGAAGADTLIGGLGNDTYLVDNARDVISETSTLPGELDTVRSSVGYVLGSNVEWLVLTGSATTSGTGNALANRLIGNTAANVLNGASGADTLVGGAGNDAYVVDSLLDRVLETSTLATEIDTVSSAVSFTLGSNLERLTLTGSAAINGSGNTLANLMTGNAAANALSGGAGNDILIGGAGNDVLTGGIGRDVFRFTVAPNASTNVDRIADFSVVDDTIQLENAVFAKLATTGTLSAANFRSGVGAHALDSNDYVIYDSRTGKLYYDADGSGAGGAVQIASLTGTPAITSSDIFIT